jgi:hypothetical protein
MRTAHDELANVRLHPPKDESWPVAVVYEDTGSRERALNLCHHLAQGFRAEIDFSFTWWRFRYLEDPDIAQAAAQAAAVADILLFSASSHADLPEEVRNWTELWVPLRTRSEGVLLVLTADLEEVELSASPLFLFLRNLARRASMDCLPRLADDPWTTPPVSVRNLQNRADQGTRILDDILRHVPPTPAPPTHWGINE